MIRLKVCPRHKPDGCAGSTKGSFISRQADLGAFDEQPLPQGSVRELETEGLSCRCTAGAWLGPALWRRSSSRRSRSRRGHFPGALDPLAGDERGGADVRHGSVVQSTFPMRCRPSAPRWRGYGLLVLGIGARLQVPAVPASSNDMVAPSWRLAMLAGRTLVPVAELLRRHPGERRGVGPRGGPVDSAGEVLPERTQGLDLGRGRAPSWRPGRSWGCNPCWAACRQKVAKSGGRGKSRRSRSPQP